MALIRRDITAERQRRLADLLSQVDENLTISGVRLAKTMGAGGAASARFAHIRRTRRPRSPVAAG